MAADRDHRVGHDVADEVGGAAHGGSLVVRHVANSRAGSSASSAPSGPAGVRLSPGPVKLTDDLSVGRRAGPNQGLPAPGQGSPVPNRLPGRPVAVAGESAGLSGPRGPGPSGRSGALRPLTSSGSTQQDRSRIDPALT
ncbi:hypothetical protein GCM10010246_14920 [Streptomyces cuspidosporus]|uniref:Uncharacterized protein n=1 Tax=Streptomyces cuspidosporus TaxID=66882 RepID=A0ABP5SJ83_9ACTN